MAKKGRAGPALTIAAIGSFIGGTWPRSVWCCWRCAHSPSAHVRPARVLCTHVLGLSLVTGLAGKSLVRAMISAILGLMVAMVGSTP